MSIHCGVERSAHAECLRVSTGLYPKVQRHSKLYTAMIDFRVINSEELHLHKRILHLHNGHKLKIALFSCCVSCHGRIYIPFIGAECLLRSREITEVSICWLCIFWAVVFYNSRCFIIFRLKLSHLLLSAPMPPHGTVWETLNS